MINKNPTYLLEVKIEGKKELRNFVNRIQDIIRNLSIYNFSRPSLRDRTVYNILDNVSSALIAISTEIIFL